MTHTIEATPASQQQVDDFLRNVREASLKSLYFFAKVVLGPSDKPNDIVPHVHLPLCQMLEKFETNTRLAVELPRGFLKSTICSVAYPIWRACRNPNVRVCVVQNSKKNAENKLNAIDAHFQQNELFQMLFPELMPNEKCMWNRGQMTVPRTAILDEATFTAAGTREKLTSNHFDVIIEDDTVTPDLDDLTAENVMPNPEDIAQAKGFHRLCIPLLDNGVRSQIIVVGTRWSGEDLLDDIRKTQTNYKWYRRFALETNGEPDMQGTPSFPEKYSREVLEETRRGLGDYLFMLNYMGTPMGEENMLVKPRDFQFYDVHPGNLLIYTTVDPAGDPSMTKTDRNDYNAVVTCGKDPTTGYVYVLDYWRKRASASEVIEELFRQNSVWKPIKFACEEIAYQHQLRYWTMEKMREKSIHFRIEPISGARRSKPQKFMGLGPIIANGTLRFRVEHRELISELQTIRCDGKSLGANDDLADALAMQVSLWQLTAGESPIAPSRDGKYRLEDALADLEARYGPGDGELDRAMETAYGQRYRNN